MILKTKSSSKIFLFIMILFTSVHIYSQNTWQQRVEYDIDVTLNDVNHTLQGNEKLTYYNQSDKALSIIYFHLYANAYKDRTSALAKEQIASNNTSLYFADKLDRGYIDSLHFKVDGKEAKFELLQNNIDIGILYLNTPLLPKSQIEIETPFFVKIPGNYSRLSHVGQSYQICQWYPKPAVYDNKGWHAMPYHDLGEFYSEFGSYKVSITLPKNYIVGATGILQNNEEQVFLDKLAQDSSDSDDSHIYFPPSSTQLKTITYIQDSIHDFAWFADKRFIVRKSAIELPISKKNVTTYVMYTGYNSDLWESAIKFVNRSLLFYSEKVGEYPYAVYTAIDGTLSAGGGMEYPMITNINSPSDMHELDIVITHEVGHSWFYGILASNERDEPWLDEGINSYYENLYNKKYYPTEKLYSQILPRKSLAKILGFAEFPDSYKNKLFYLFSANKREDQPIALKSREISETNYGAIIYSKTPLVLDYIANYMGTSAFEIAMHDYFNNFQFKHPSSSDFINELQKHTKQNLCLLTISLIKINSYQNTTIKNIKNSNSNTINIKLNKNKANITYPITYEFTSSKDSSTIWYDTNRISISNPDIKSIHLMGNIDNTNTPFNDEKYELINGKWKRALPNVKVKMIGLVRAANQRQLNILPAIGFNNYDYLMLGVFLYNSPIPSPKFEYQLAPMFSLASLKPVGMGRITYHCYPKKISILDFSLKAQSFSEGNYIDETTKKKKWLTFINFQPSIKIGFKNKSIYSSVEKSLTIMSSIVYQQFLSDFDKTKRVANYFQTGIIKFDFKNAKKINPYSFQSSIQFSGDFASFQNIAKYAISYNKARNAIDIRLFAGVMLFKKTITIDPQKGLLPPNRSLTVSSNSLVGNYSNKMNEDYTYESIYLDRNGASTVLSHQVFTNKEGGFRSLIGSGLGNSEKWLISLNISASLPKRIPIKPFVCIGTGYLFSYKTNTYKQGEVLAEAGLSLVGLKDVFEIHFPLLITNNIKENQKFNFGIDKFYERITFTLDLNLLNPFEKIRNFKL